MAVDSYPRRARPRYALLKKKLLKAVPARVEFDALAVKGHFHNSQES